jgi:periplasmic divalent cation tolerance protein
MPTPTADPPAHRLLVTTFPDEEVAAHIARTLVDERLAACVNLVPGVRSIYRWQGAVEEGAEIVGLIKTTAAEAPRLIARLTELHPYEVPEAIALDITDGHPPYLAWLAGSVGR